MPSSSKSKPAARISARALPSPDDASSDSELELDPVADDDSDDAASSAPDSPLLAPTTTQPRWLQAAQPKWLRADRISRCARWWRRILASLAALLPPRRSWPFAALVVVSAYVLLCVVRGVPLLASPLPPYSGPYGVGAVDVEIALEKPRRISETVFKSNGEPAFEHRTTLFSLYYPIDKSVKERRRRHDWFARPLSLIAAGYAKYAHVNNFFIRPIFTFGLWFVAGGITIPANVDAPLLGTTATIKTEAEWTQGESTKVELRKRDHVEQFPVMVFSHGDASSRRDYTHYVGELASRGYIIAAVEHRDGSCPGSLMRIKGEKDKQLLHFKAAELLSDPPMDTEKYKQEQLAFRDAEILETINILRAINSGQGDDIFSRNSRSEGSYLHSWAGRLDFGNLTIGGHSFGATGALQALKHAPSDINPAIGGVILDPGKQSGPLNALIDVPLLIVHSNSWSKQHSAFYDRPHFDTVKDLALSVLRRIPSHSSWFLTSIGTSHPSVSDAPLIEPLLLRWTTGASLDTKEALEEYVRVTDDFWHFLRTTRSVNSSLTDGVVHRGEMRGILAEKVTHEQYGKWVSKERKAEFPKPLARLWEVHVSPVADEDE
ncbi:platelet-activating factor acetylhydrolase homolog 2 [Trichoderma asperellum]|uniref:Putative phospholipase n=1 Tax=Trichoderma asperellum TaxID=101201 RepID=A0A6V8R4J0_TRIAP|nr:platelet-activating factor acetylhydrolase homolog 2 [Trichoderma asperellum]